MSQKVFGDVDLSVHVSRNPTITNSNGQQYEYSGLVFQVNCQDCETPTKMALQWNEVRTLLEGGLVNGVTRTNDGWIIAVQCQATGGCQQVTQISVTDEEMERHAQLEVSRRRRNAQAQGVPQQPMPRQQMPRQQMQRPQQPMRQRPPQMVRRPMPRG